MAIFFSQGGFALTPNSGPIDMVLSKGFVISSADKLPTVCYDAVFQDTISLKAIWPKCND